MKGISDAKKRKIGQKIHNVRVNRKMSVDDLATRLKVHRDTVFKWESGKRCPDLLSMRLISRVLHISFRSILPF